jgi:hypothetical protein
MPKRAVAISYNWITERTMHTPFEGDDAAELAESWVDTESFVWRDFPASEGWVHFCHWNDEAQAARADYLLRAILGGSYAERAAPRGGGE